MKKSFLKTCIALSFLGVFLIVDISFVDAQTEYQQNNENIVEKVDQGDISQASALYQMYKATQLLPQDNFVRRNVDTAVNKGTSAIVGSVLDPIAKSTIMPLIQTGAVAGLKLIQLGLWSSGKIFDGIMEAMIGNQDIYKGFEKSIDDSWKIVRDIANIFIVFSLLYLGIKTIFNGNGFAETKTLISIIIAAILINFSLLLTQAVYQVSNTIGSQIADQIAVEGKSGDGTSSISTGLMEMINPQTVMAVMWNDLAFADWSEMWNRVQVAILIGIIMFMVALILFGASVLLLYRFVIFIVLMITSPVGITSKFVPWFSGIGEKWWSMLKSQAIALPAFLLTLYISILFVAPLARQLDGNAFAMVASGQISDPTKMTSAAIFILHFLLIIGFLLLPLIVPGKLGAAGSEMMTNISKWTTQKVKNIPRRSAGLAAGGTAIGGRLIGGKLIGKKLLTDNERLKKAAQGKGVGAFLAQMGLKTGAGLQNKTYDARNIDAVKKSDFGKGMGSGIKSYTDEVKAKQKEWEKRKDEEKKLFGFEDLGKSKEHKAEVLAAKQARNLKNLEIKALQKEAMKNTHPDGSAKTDAEKEAERFVIVAREKELEDLELKVGELTNVADFEYMKQLENRWISKYNPKVTSRDGLAKMKKDLEKKLKKEGQSTEKKKDAAALASPPSPAPTPPPSTP